MSQFADQLPLLPGIQEAFVLRWQKREGWHRLKIKCFLLGVEGRWGRARHIGIVSLVGGSKVTVGAIGALNQALTCAGNSKVVCETKAKVSTRLASWEALSA